VRRRCRILVNGALRGVLLAVSGKELVLDERGSEDVCLFIGDWIDVDEMLRFERMGLRCLLIFGVIHYSNIAACRCYIIIKLY